MTTLLDHSKAHSQLNVDFFQNKILQRFFDETGGDMIMKGQQSPKLDLQINFLFQKWAIILLISFDWFGRHFW